MALIDWVMVVVLLVSVLSAAKKGFFLEIFSLAGVIAGLLLASWNYRKLMPWLVGWVHSYPASEAISFIAIAIGVMIVAGLIGRLIRWSVHSVGLGWADRFVGAIFGFVKGCALITVAVLVVAAFVPQAPWFRQSRLAPYFLTAAHQASVVTPNDLGERIRQGVTAIRNAQPLWLRPSAEAFPGTIVPALSSQTCSL
jgi:membrane protein required for colicin V production